MAPVKVLSPHLCVAAGLWHGLWHRGCMAVKPSLAGTVNLLQKVNAA